MRRILVVLIVFLLMASIAKATDYMLNGVAATGASDELVLNQLMSNHTVGVFFVDADSSISAATVVLQGCNDHTGVTAANCHWNDLATHVLAAADLSAKQAMFHVTGKAVPRVRVNLTVLTGAGAGDEIYVTYNPGR